MAVPNPQEQLAKLTEYLFSSTSHGKIKWLPTADENSFRAVLKTAIVRVEKFRPSERPFGVATSALAGMLPDPVVFAVVVVDDKNRTISRYIPDEKSGQTAMVRELWDLARSSALGVDEKINDLLHELQGLATQGVLPQ